MASSTTNNPLILNYHDAILYESDLQLLKNPTAWLNDACINFGMIRLAQQHAANDSDGIVFLDPAVISFFMHQCTDEEEIQEFIDSNQYLLSSRLILLPINNGHAPSSTWHYQKGTHWSLLAIVRSNNSNGKHDYFYFDSVEGSNLVTAQAVANKFRSVLSSQSTTPTSAGTVVECETPQQVNGYDCGLHVLATAEYLANMVTINAESMKNVQVGDMLQLRTTLAAEVAQLAKEYSVN